MGNLKITCERPQQDVTELKLEGEFEGYGALDAEEELFQYLNRCMTPKVILNFEKIEYIDSAAVGLLIKLAMAAKQKGSKFGITKINQNIKKVIEVTKVDKIIKIC